MPLNLSKQAVNVLLSFLQIGLRNLLCCRMRTSAEIARPEPGHDSEPGKDNYGGKDILGLHN